MKEIEHNIMTIGLVVELTTSQTKNFEIIQKHWINFNHELKKWKLAQVNGDWVKYGITFKIDEQYFYLTSIPTADKSFPRHFKRLDIPKGMYEVFAHKGEMRNIKNTLFNIYKVMLPKSNLTFEKETESGILHFEKYDYRFQWNKPTSIIDIYLPLKTAHNDE